MRRVWYTRPVSDEGDVLDETQLKTEEDVDDEKKIIAPDIDTSHSPNAKHTSESSDNDEKIQGEEKSGPAPYWLSEQVYGDKVNSNNHILSRVVQSICAVLYSFR